MSVSRLFRWIFTIVIVATFATIFWNEKAYANLDIADLNVSLIKIMPVGSTNKGVISFSASATGTAENITSLQVTANATLFGSTGINSVKLYRSTDATFDPNADTEIVEKTVTTAGSSVTLSGFSDAVALNTTVNYFIAIGLATNASPTQNVSFTLSQVNGGTPSPNAFTKSGYGFSSLDITGTDQLPDVIVPDQKNISALKFDVTPNIEGINIQTIVINNNKGTFATDATTNQNIVKVSLYKDTGNGTFETTDTLLESKGKDQANNIDSTTSITFTAANFANSSDRQIISGTKTTYFVVYDVGVSTNVSNFPEAGVQLAGFNSTGDQSSSSLIATPSSAFETPIGGLSVSEFEGIVPSSSTFGPGNRTPMVKFKLRAEQLAATLNSVTIENTGSIPFVTLSSQTDGITTVELFQDANSNGQFDDTSGGDTSLGTLTLGAGNNTATKGTISLSSSLQFPTSNSTLDNGKTLFVVYTAGTGISSSNSTANVVLSEAAASTNVGATTHDLSLAGTVPLTTTQNAELGVQQTKLRLVQVTDISGASTVQGQVKAPMLYVQLQADEDVPSASIVIKNDKSTFQGTGASKVWLYRDNTPLQSFDSSDVLISAVVPSNTTSATLPAFPMSSNSTHHLLVLYDIGQNANIATNAVSAQLSDVTSTVSGNILGGEVPTPKIPATSSIVGRFLNVSSVSSSQSSITNNSPTFNVTLKVQNVSANAITVTDIIPRFYASDNGGVDISSQFNIVSTGTTVANTTIPASQTATVTFDVGPSKVSNKGAVFIDGYVRYTTSGTNSAELLRYFNGNEWVLAAGSNSASVITDSDRTLYSWDIPDYIASINVLHGNVWQPFQNGNAIPANTQMRIFLLNEGKYVDPSSIQIWIGENTVPASTQATSSSVSSFTYTDASGLITVSDVGTANNTLRLAINDLNGNALPETSLTYQISQTLKITDFLFYPNPFTPGTDQLEFGFNLTKDATVTIYIFNSLGRRVYKEALTGTLGYNLFQKDIRIGGRYLPSGTYIAKIVAVDSAGDKSHITTKFAVY